MQNRELLNYFIEKGIIHIKPGKLLDQHVEPKSSDFNFGKVEGMLLGVAVGDSLGITTEAMLPSRRREAYGELRDYIPNRYVNESKGFPSDDTQLTFWNLEQLIADNGFLSENVAKHFAGRGRIFGIGRTVRTFLQNMGDGKPWYECGPKSAGNGSLDYCCRIN